MGIDYDLLEKRLAPLLKGSSRLEAAARHVHGWLLASRPDERYQINAFNLATEEFALPDILEVLLLGIAKEVFTLSWQLHCPHCDMITDSYSTLNSVHGGSHCKMCDADYTADFHERVEVTFTLAKDIEDLNLPPFCAPPAALKSLISLQIPMRESREADIELTSGEYRYFCPITLSRGIIDVAGEPTAEVQQMQVTQLEGRFAVERVQLKPGKVHIVAENLGAPIAGLFVHENKLPNSLALAQLKPRVTGMMLQHMPAFQRLFGKEALSNRERMNISAVTIVFTDISASTQMYERLGDARAYNIVRDHFEILISAIEVHGGIIIKTIGDAVMASFIENAAAMRAIFAAQAQMQAYNEVKAIDEKVRLKIGMHRGPAILVNLNDRLDYFGSSVNKAARVQSAAGSDEVSLSREVVDDPKVQRELLQHGIRRLKRVRRSLKGLEGKHEILRFAWGRS